MHSFSYNQVTAREWRRSGWILVNGIWMVNSTPPPPPPSCLLSAAQSHTTAFYVRVQLQPIRISGLPPLQLDSSPPPGHIYSSAHSVCSSVQCAAVGLRGRALCHWQTHRHCESIFTSINCISSLQRILCCCCVSCILALRWDVPQGTSPANRRQRQPQPWRDRHKKEGQKSLRSFHP